MVEMFNPVIYPLKVWVGIGSKEMSKFVDVDGRELIGAPHLFEGAVWKVIEKKTRYRGVLVLFEKRKSVTMKNAAHEATHVVRKMWEMIGETFTGEEADAYLVGWVVECIKKVKKGYGKK